MVIVSCWESPTNEGTERYTVAGLFPKRPCSRTWIVGEIRVDEGCAEEGWPLTVDVYDFDGSIRVELPIRSTAIEYGPDPWLVN